MKNPIFSGIISFYLLNIIKIFDDISECFIRNITPLYLVGVSDPSQGCCELGMEKAK